MNPNKQEYGVALAPVPEVVSRLLLAYITDDVILSEDEKRVYERLVAADEAIKDTSYDSNEKRAKDLARKFNISIRTARNDLRSAIEFFNTTDLIDIKTGARILLSQIDKLTNLILGSDRESEERSIDPKTYKDVVNLLKLKKEVYVEMIGPGVFDPKLLQQNNYVFNFGKEGAERLKLEKGASRKEILALLRQHELSKVQEQQLMRDAEFEELDG